MTISAKPIIGVDLMGGDHPPHQLLSDILEHISKKPLNAKIIFFCSIDHLTLIQSVLKSSLCITFLDYEIVPKQEYITLEDHTLTALKTKKDSSLWQGVLDLKAKKVDALISVGNTGALLAICHFCLELLPKVHRPALLTKMPSMKNSITLLDVGANTTATKEQLLQFSLIGSAYLKSLGNEHFKIGLLNIGTEEHKGTVERKEALALIKSYHHQHPERIPHFIGNIEPQDVFLGNCELVVTDGFSGNIFLKSAEGTSQLILKKLRTLNHPFISKELVSDLVQHLRPIFEHEVYPGALLAGVSGIVIKCHSYFDGRAIYHSIIHAIELHQGNFLEKLKKNLS